MFDEFIDVITTVGFPIFVAMFLLIRIEKKLENGFNRVVDAINGKTLTKD